MVGSDGFDNISIPVQMSKESDFLIPVAQLMENVSIFILCCGVGNFTPKQAKGFQRARRIHGPDTDTFELEPWLWFQSKSTRA
jgi:hypothetical protein